MIEWHKETWYSSLGTFVFLAVGLPVLFFYIGLQYVEFAKVDADAQANIKTAITNLSQEVERRGSAVATTTP